MTNKSIHYSIGFSAFQRGQPLNTNAHSDWQEGWEDARQKNEWDNEVPYNEHHNIHEHHLTPIGEPVDHFEYFGDNVC